MQNDKLSLITGDCASWSQRPEHLACPWWHSRLLKCKWDKRWGQQKVKLCWLASCPVVDKNICGSRTVMIGSLLRHWHLSVPRWHDKSWNKLWRCTTLLKRDVYISPLCTWCMVHVRQSLAAENVGTAHSSIVVSSSRGAVVTITFFVLRAANELLCAWNTVSWVQNW